MSNYDLNTRLIDVTLGEFLEAIEDRLKEYQQPERSEKRFVYGLKGMAKLLGCSKTTAARLKASGDYDEAITQIGALLLIDKDEVLRIARERQNNK